ncbi:MAG TPA: NAD(P)-binding domain-containing protein [Elusimicrobiota bacterium]|nr:NAD(P)-binding domain-containing protein [Elusimicrobiota bacterium]
MFKILIVGAGNIGRRHLQALLKLDSPVEICVVDPSPESLRLAKESVGRGARGRVELVRSKELPAGPRDLVVVATASDVRLAAASAAVRDVKPRFLILEKFLFQREKDYADFGRILRRSRTRCWVNCPRRLWPVYRGLRDAFAGSTTMKLSLAGSRVGLGCNGIHIVDLLAFLFGRGPLDLRFEARFLDGRIAPSKRPDFIEFTGMLVGAGGGAAIDLHSFAGHETPEVLTVSSDTANAVVEEAGGLVRLSLSSRGWKWTQSRFKAPYQSELTNAVAADLIRRGDCGLTPYAESASYHLALLKAFNAHLARVQGRAPAACPIT